MHCRPRSLSRRSRSEGTLTSTSPWSATLTRWPPRAGSSPWSRPPLKRQTRRTKSNRESPCSARSSKSSFRSATFISRWTTASLLSFSFRRLTTRRRISRPPAKTFSTSSSEERASSLIARWLSTISTKTKKKLPQNYFTLTTKD